MNDHMNRHLDDVRHLVEVCAARDIVVTEQEAYDAWSAYSDTSAAGWLIMDGEDEDRLASIVERFLPARPRTPLL